jgi:hypothetical protein
MYVDGSNSNATNNNTSTRHKTYSVSNIESGGDDSALVDSSDEVDHNLAGAVVVQDLELSNVSVLLHDLEELHHDLGGRSDDDLSLSTLLSVRHGLKAIGKHRHTCHLQKKHSTE